LPNVGPYIYDVSISGFTRSSIYIYDISSLRVKAVNVIALRQRTYDGMAFLEVRNNLVSCVCCVCSHRPLLHSVTAHTELGWVRSSVCDVSVKS